jgi:flavin-binding protein dodecin
MEDAFMSESNRAGAVRVVGRSDEGLKKAMMDGVARACAGGAEVSRVRVVAIETTVAAGAVAEWLVTLEAS